MGGKYCSFILSLLDELEFRDGRLFRVNKFMVVYSCRIIVQLPPFGQLLAHARLANPTRILHVNLP